MSAPQQDRVGCGEGRPARVLVLANFDKPAARELAQELEPWLAERVERVDVEPDIRAYCARRESWDHGRRRADRPDVAIVLGGDGALLGAVRAFAVQPVPTVGINLGRVGFLASTPASRWRDTLERVLAGACELEHRMRLEANWRLADGSGGHAVALNEVALQRSSQQGMLRATLHVDGLWVTDYRADGLILATPSGSTAYSLSAGGPILEPAVNGFAVTPICSYGLANRAIVLHGDAELQLTVDASSGVTTMGIDGQEFHPIREGDVLTLRRHPEPFPLHAMPGLDPYRRLRDRLGWGGGDVSRPPSG